MVLLTAEDVLNKAFSKTKYREGFDQDEVDDFLDEVADTIAKLTAERDDLAARLAQAQQGGAVAAAVSTATPESFIAAATDPNPTSATSMLAMAQKLHDEYLSAGEAERNKIIAEAHKEAEQIVKRAEEEAKVRMASLESERADLERKIDDLRRFERDYRNHLKSYLENFLGDLEHGAQKGTTGSVPTVTGALAALNAGATSGSTPGGGTPSASGSTPSGGTLSVAGTPSGGTPSPGVFAPASGSTPAAGSPAAATPSSGSIMTPATSSATPVAPMATPVPSLFEATAAEEAAQPKADGQATDSIPQVTRRPVTPTSDSPASQPLPQWPTA